MDNFQQSGERMSERSLLNLMPRSMPRSLQALASVPATLSVLA